MKPDIKRFAEMHITVANVSFTFAKAIPTSERKIIRKGKLPVVS